jgi:hypothetical protein
MTIAGTIQNGVVILDGAPPLADGTRVEVVVAEVAPPRDESVKQGEPTIRSLLKFAGRANDLPADMAAQHDHYLHGAPKR